jgi:hypothetical protein
VKRKIKSKHILTAHEEGSNVSGNSKYDGADFEQDEELKEHPKSSKKPLSPPVKSSHQGNEDSSSSVLIRKKSRIHLRKNETPDRVNGIPSAPLEADENSSGKKHSKEN